MLIKDEMFEEDQTQRLYIRDGGEWMKEHKPPFINEVEYPTKIPILKFDLTLFLFFQKLQILHHRLEKLVLEMFRW